MHQSKMWGDQDVMKLNFPTEHDNEKVAVLDENIYLLGASRQCESSFHYPANWLT